MRTVLMLAAGLACPGVAAAQQALDSLGSRALGMAGAFVAVADDASAAHWNPAGLVTGPPIAATIEWTRFQNGDPDGPPRPGAGRRRGGFWGFTAGPIGLSHSQLQATVLRAGADSLAVETTSASQFGVTLVQSVMPGLVVGSTLKHVRGFHAVGPGIGLTAREALDGGDALEGRSEGRFDLDVGVMLDLVRFRVGVVARNLREVRVPGPAGSAVLLARQVRLGVAALPAAGLTLAMDVDLDTVDLRGDLRRAIAVGGEKRIHARLAVRGGVRWDLETRGPLVPAAGASLALRRGLWLDGHAAPSRSGTGGGFGVALRVGP